jgi:biopolymer transport protein ExbD
MASIELAGAGRRDGRIRRIGFRLDMTPLVDVAFLLLTFFMFATTMSQPQAMEIRMPPSDAPADVPQSTMLTVLVRDDGAIFTRIGDAAPVRTTLEGIESIASDRIRSVGNDLVTALRAAPAASYGTVVAVLDRLNAVEARMEEEFAMRAERRQRRFTIAPFGESDRRAITGR